MAVKGAVGGEGILKELSPSAPPQWVLTAGPLETSPTGFWRG